MPRRCAPFCCASFVPPSSIAIFRSFLCLSLLGGVAAIIFSEDAHSIAFLILQVALYFVSLFALLAGVSSAQAEREEWQMLFAQPVPRAAYVIGKFIAYLSIFGAVLLLLFLPGICGRLRCDKESRCSICRLCCSRPRFLRSDWPRDFSHTIARKRSSSA